MVPGHAWRDSDALSGDVQRFSAFLDRSGLSRLVVEQTETRAVLAFTGPFEGHEVVWRCEFVTLDAELQRLAQKNSPLPKGLCNFIEIGDPQSEGVPLRVGLALTRVDSAAIDKMILMIRLYKNLKRGRHEYGKAVN
jgi:hypothetical protein